MWLGWGLVATGGITADTGHIVAGIAGAVAGNGVAVAGIAPRARILSIKIPLGNAPPDPECAQAVASLTQAIKVAVESGADVINMSLGRMWYWGVSYHVGRGYPFGYYEWGGAGRSCG